MPHRRQLFRLAGLALPLAWALCATGPGQTPLDKYVYAPDSHFRYSLVTTIPGAAATTFALEMTSQAWRTPSEVDRPEWKHWVFIYHPKSVASTTGLLFIGGSSNDRPMPKPNSALARMAEATRSVVAELHMIPNQPLRFANDTYGPRSEDEIVAYTWVKYLKTSDPTWPLRLPMTKAAVRAMDAITAFLAGRGGVQVDRFAVAGGSKRGWTTWTTAAVDKRVVAIMPLVIDLLNIEKSFEHHYRAYGFWAPAVKDYENAGLMNKFHDPKFRELMRIVEPYEYRDRFTMPKYLVNSAGDQFFLPDSSQFYFDDLPGEKYLRYIPNTDHSLKDSDVYESLTAFYEAVLRGKPRPRFSWKLEKTGAIRVTTTDKTISVKLWQATNSEHRDFRLDTIGPTYKSTELMPSQNGVYTASVPKPPKGFTAYFVELTFPGPDRFPFKFTTPIRVTPDILPYELPRRKRQK
jgi:PhoPQ-activated pathogenicity-related protein